MGWVYMSDTGNTYRIMVGETPWKMATLKIRKDNIKMELREVGCEVDGNGSRLHPVLSFDICSVEPLVSRSLLALYSCCSLKMKTASSSEMLAVQPTSTW